MNSISGESTSHVVTKLGMKGGDRGGDSGRAGILLKVNHATGVLRPHPSVTYTKFCHALSKFSWFLV